MPLTVRGCYGPHRGRACLIPRRKRGKVDDKWEKVRQIVREECERIEQRIVSTLQKNAKSQIKFSGGKWVGISESEMTAWTAGNPAVDVPGELLRAASWIASNPNLAPKSQFGRFIGTWLSRTQNQRSLHAIPTSRPAEHKQKHCAYCELVASGSVNGIWHCSNHMHDAMDRKPRGHMWGVPAKPVAGAD